MTDDRAHRPDAVAAAAHWDARLRSPRCTEAERAAFRAWEAESPQNAAAFERLQSALDLARTMADRAHIRAFRDDALIRYRVAGKRRAAIGWVAAASLALLIGTAVLRGDGLIGPAVDVDQPQVAANTVSAPRAPVFDAPSGSRAVDATWPVRSYRTGANERTEVRLDDGSIVVLNANTQMVTRFTAHRRDIAMLGGQAFFRVDKDPSRPFVVRAGDREVVAVGTAFEVRMNRHSLDVTLLEGRVTVKPVDGIAGVPVIHLTPDQRAVITEKAQPLVTAVNSSLETGWAEGRLYFDDTPLDQAVDLMNRHSAVKMELGDRSLAAYRISGMFRIGGQSSFVEALQAYFPISATRRSENLIILAPAPQAGKAPSKK